MSFKNEGEVIPPAPVVEPVVPPVIAPEVPAAEPGNPPAPITPPVVTEEDEGGEELKAIKKLVEEQNAKIDDLTHLVQILAAANPVAPANEPVEKTLPPPASGLKFVLTSKKTKGLTVADIQNLSDSVSAKAQANLKQIINQLKGKVE